MVIVKNKKLPVTIYPPKTTTRSAKELLLTLHSISSNSDFTFPVTDTGKWRDYYEVDVDFRLTQDGEYEYRIGCDNGLLVIGDYKEKRKQENKQYDGETKYYQYEN